MKARSREAMCPLRWTWLALLFAGVLLAASVALVGFGFAHLGPPQSSLRPVTEPPQTAVSTTPTRPPK